MRPDGKSNAPGAPGFRIRDLHAFVAIDPADDSEGIVGMIDPATGAHMPLIGADEARIKAYQPYAEEAAKVTGQPIKLVRFSAREDLETITG